MIKVLAVLLFAGFVQAQLPTCGTECLQGWVLVQRQVTSSSTFATPPYILIEARDQKVAPTAGFNSVRTCVFTTPRDNSSAWCNPGTGTSFTVQAKYRLSDGATGCGGCTQVTFPTTASPSWLLDDATTDLHNGSQYYLCPWVISKTSDDQSHDLLLDFARQGTYEQSAGRSNACYPFKYDVANSNVLPDFNAVTGNVFVADAAHTQVLVNASDPCSIGSASANQCGAIAAGNSLGTVGGNTIYDNGFAGSFLAKHSIPVNASNVSVITETVADTMTFAAFTSDIGPAIAALPSNTRMLAITWARPNVVTVGVTGWTNCEGATGPATGSCFGIAGLAAMWNVTGGTIPAGSFCVDKNYGVGQIGYNPYFNNPVTTPNSSLGFIPTFQAAAFKCTTGWNGSSGCDQNHTANGGMTEDVATFNALESGLITNPTNPSGLLLNVIYTNDASRGGIYPSQYAPANNGTAVTSKITNSLLGSFASQRLVNPPSGGPAGTYIVYANGAQNGNFSTGGTTYAAATTNFLAGGGTYLDATSFAASFIAGGNGQSFSGMTLAAALGGPLTPPVLAPGTAVEPCNDFQEKLLRWDLYERYLIAGNTLGQAAWLSIRDPWNFNIWGDGLARVWSSSTPTFYIP